MVEFAIKGMHFDRYLHSKFQLNAYGKYFWYQKCVSATQLIAVYDGKKLLGVLTAEMKREKKRYQSFAKKMYIRIVDYVQMIFSKKEVISLDNAKEELIKNYTTNYSPDGEIQFLAVAPDVKGKGIGTILLDEFEKREPNKEIYLLADDQCTYQFYEHRGFERIGEREIALEMEEKMNSKRFLYRKKIGF